MASEALIETAQSMFGRQISKTSIDLSSTVTKRDTVELVQVISHLDAREIDRAFHNRGHFTPAN